MSHQSIYDGQLLLVLNFRVSRLRADGHLLVQRPGKLVVHLHFHSHSYLRILFDSIQTIRDTLNNLAQLLDYESMITQT